MHASRTTQFIVGLFALAGLAALAYLCFRLGQISVFAPSGYELYANFDNISGLKNGDSVEIAGVHVGKVDKISLQDDRARVRMSIQPGVQIDEDAMAAIRTMGIIGDKYVSISLGPSDKMLANGGTIRQTESAFVLEEAIGQLINNMGTTGSKKQSEEKGTDGLESPPGIGDPGTPKPAPSPR
jgi:phospholipid/cholesterol/gamma-HCH transport system substrate-binding protein